MDLRYDCLTVTLNPAVDKFQEIRSFIPGTTYRTGTPLLAAGGKGINVGRALLALGIKTVQTGFLAGANGEYFKQEMNRGGLPHKFLFVDGETRVSLTIKDSNHRTVTRILEAGPKVSPKDKQEFLKVFNRLIKPCSYVILSGRNVPGVADSFYAQLIRLAKKAKKKVILDTSGEPLAQGVKAKPDIIKPNRIEAEGLWGRKIKTEEHLRSVVDALLARGISQVMISLGEVGLVLADKQERFWARPPKIKAVSTVGCGDATIAGLIFAQIQGASLQEAALWATAVGTCSAQTSVPGFVKRTAVKKMAKRISVQPL